MDVAGNAKDADEKRKQSIATLGHDLKVALAVLSSGARLMANAGSSERAAEIETVMQSKVHEAVGLVDRLVLFAQDKLKTS